MPLLMTAEPELLTGLDMNPSGRGQHRFWQPEWDWLTRAGEEGDRKWAGGCTS